MPIHYDKNDEHIVLVTIDRPEARNALDGPHMQALSDCWREFKADTDAWVVIITGVGDAFCAGADLKEFIPKITGSNWADYRAQVDEDLADGTASNFTLRGFDLYKPIIAAVNGHCVAGGMEMLGGTDIRIASTNASFGVQEPRFGLFAGGGTTSRLPRQLSWPAAMEFLLTADRIPAERAFHLGLVNEVVPQDALVERAYEWARRITKNAPVAVQATKESALRGLGAGSLEAAFAIEDEMTQRVFTSEDAKEGPRAFAEKRQPQWTGR
jgi:enoyl-CoA hydratase